MSRIGKQPIKIPKEVTVSVEDKTILVKGPKGAIQQHLLPGFKIEQLGDQIIVKTIHDTDKNKALHGLLRSLLANAVIGVINGFEKQLELVGTGYRVKKEQNKLIFNLGFSHTKIIEEPPGIALEVEGQKDITVKGIDKQIVGQVAADIRNLKRPEPYKGKGIRYKGEIIKIKPGKAAKIGTAQGGA